MRAASVSIGPRGCTHGRRPAPTPFRAGARAGPAGRLAGRGSGALLNLVEGVRLETMGLAVDPRRTLLVRRIDEAKDLALRLVDPVVLVVHAVLGLHAQVRFVGSNDICGRDLGRKAYNLTA